MKILIPKTVKLTQEVLATLRKEFALSDIQIAELEYWNGEHSPNYGTVLEKGADSFPYTVEPDQFKLIYPDGRVWGEETMPA